MSDSKITTHVYGTDYIVDLQHTAYTAISALASL